MGDLRQDGDLLLYCSRCGDTHYYRTSEIERLIYAMNQMIRDVSPGSKNVCTEDVLIVSYHAYREVVEKWILKREEA